MNHTLLVVGSGGREHALAARLSRCASVGRVVVCPGNAGIGGAIGVATGDVLALAERLEPDLVVVGPEGPLCEGLVDQLASRGILAYGPSRDAAELEASKAFMKQFAERHGVRTARFVEVVDVASLPAALAQFTAPPVVKADGLAAGKGVVVAESFDEAERAARSMLSGEAFGPAGRRVVIEERLVGQEVSIHAICDGERWFLLPAIQDHKRIGEGDRGPNTGGMGTYGPAAIVDALQSQRIEREIVARIVDGMREEGRPYIGTLFAGLMISPEGEPVLLEINVRFGDPETQVLMNLLDGDVAALLRSAAQGALAVGDVVIKRAFGMCVVMAAAGYPSAPRVGDAISGLDAAARVEGVEVYHAGTRWAEGRVLTAGGRVLGVTASAPSLAEARRRVYAACDCIHFDGAQFRRDIGHRELRP